MIAPFCPYETLPITFTVFTLCGQPICLAGFSGLTILVNLPVSFPKQLSAHLSVHSSASSFLARDCVSLAGVWQMFCPQGALRHPPPCSLLPPPPTGITGSYSVSESHFFSPIQLHSGLVWTAEAPAEAAPGQRKKELGVSPASLPRGLAEV